MMQKRAPLTTIALAMTLTRCSSAQLAPAPASPAHAARAAQAAQERTPTITEYALPNGTFPGLNITPGPDGALWFTIPEPSQGLIGRITTTGQVTEYSLGSVDANPYGIVAGPDGALWFTPANGGSIGRITTAGAVSWYPIRKPGCYQCSMGDIAVGADGGIWATDSGHHKIYRVDPSTGHIKSYPISGYPLGIAPGPDASLWFAQANAGKIGAIAASGHVTEFAVGGQPEFVAAGASNSVWFTAYGAVGRLEPSGRFALYPVSGFVPFGIARGPDGAMWFTEGDVGKIGRITNSGKLQEFDLPNPDSFPFGIALGSDGALWFAEQNQAKIGRIAPR
jgi:virginiamycin B lyase